MWLVQGCSDAILEQMKWKPYEYSNNSKLNTIHKTNLKLDAAHLETYFDNFRRIKTGGNMQDGVALQIEEGEIDVSKSDENLDCLQIIFSHGNKEGCRPSFLVRNIHETGQ